MNILVFDIETVPDLEAGDRLYGLSGLSPDDAAELMFNIRRQENKGNSDLLRYPLHKIVAISLILETPDTLKIWSLGNDGDSNEQQEAELIQRFFDGIKRYSPILVSWNGSGFDLPVLHYRSLLWGVSAQHYWESGDTKQSFKWNNYLNRYHSRHTDLMDVLSGYMSQAKAPLQDIALLLGLPGKLGMSGNQVWDYYKKNELEAICNYCEIDVLNTYLIYLRYQLISGQVSADQYQQKCEQTAEMLAQSESSHLLNFLSIWKGRTTT